MFEEPAQYTVAKRNLGSPRVYKTRAALERALVKAGAQRITWENEALSVEWPAGVVRYAYDRDGNVDAQLAWDLESA